MYFLDSDYIINFLNGDDKTINTIQKLQSYGFSTSVINIAEIVEGLITVKNKKKISVFEQFIQTLEVFSIDLVVAYQFAQLRQILRKKGQLVDNLDLLIAATCIINNQILLTYNQNHFNRILDLQVYKKTNN